jgi:DNA-binding MarR family transcriptional regulator
LLKVEGGKSSDEREKLVSVTPEALRILGDFRQLLDQLDSKH